MNLALGQVGGELLVISQFTLLADTDIGPASFVHPRGASGGSKTSLSSTSSRWSDRRG